MLVGFKRRFGLWVWEGSKTHTIRADRADGKTAKPRRVLGIAKWDGETLYCFIDTRQPGMTRLGNFECVKVEPIVIEARSDESLQFTIAGVVLDANEANLFCWRDGFRPAGSTQERPGDAYSIFHDYWLTAHPDLWDKPFRGSLNHWEHSTNPIAATSRALGRCPLPKALQGFEA